MDMMHPEYKLRAVPSFNIIESDFNKLRINIEKSQGFID